MRKHGNVVLAAALCAAFGFGTSAEARGLGSKNAPIVVDKKILSVETSVIEDETSGKCSVLTLTLELSAPGVEPDLATETLVSCDSAGTSGEPGVIDSSNVTQYAPGGTCARGQGLRSNWTGGGTIQTQYVSYEKGGSFYIAYGSGIGLTMGSPFTWSMKLTSLDRIYAATMRTSGALSGTGTSCY